MIEPTNINRIIAHVRVKSDTIRCGFLIKGVPVSKDQALKIARILFPNISHNLEVEVQDPLAISQEAPCNEVVLSGAMPCDMHKDQPE